MTTIENRIVYRRQLLSLLSVSFVLLTSCGPGKPEDPRAVLLSLDEKRLSVEQYSGNTTLSENLGSFFQVYAHKDFKPEDWKVFSREESNRLLVIIEIPKLRKSEKGSRIELLRATESYLQDSGYPNSRIYLAIKGHMFFGAAKTPDYEHDEFPINMEKLYDFYGEKPESETR
ncbi:MAG: hypothetical protein F9K24_18680 [Leptonema illini]|uniref:Lipoprotein n=1 Tax=Leptonema illini TaxID=183 RepID=A0A833GYG7_9LEPT|nr:MAG: hypothetical protein F9K24_18680 [Leptonema illini]